MTRFTTLAVAALFSTVALAAPDAAEAQALDAVDAAAAGDRLTLRELDADAGVVLRRTLRKRARIAGVPLVVQKEISADRMLMMRKIRRIRRNRGVKPLAM